MTDPSVGCAASASGLASGRRYAFLLTDRLTQLLHVGVGCAKDSHDCVPANSSMTILDLGEVGHSDLGAGAQLLLGEPCLDAQFPKCSSEDSVILG
jgi:hypothetical protein